MARRRGLAGAPVGPQIAGRRGARATSTVVCCDVFSRRAEAEFLATRSRVDRGSRISVCSRRTVGGASLWSGFVAALARFRGQRRVPHGIAQRQIIATDYIENGALDSAALRQ